MDRFAIERPDHAPLRDPRDELKGILAKLGYDHESKQEAILSGERPPFLKIDNTAPREERRAKTLAAIKDGAGVIAQAQLEFGQFRGVADFLVKEHGKSELGDYHYEAWDAKLGLRVNPTFVIQLCCYAEMLQNIQGIDPEFITVILGDGKREKLGTNAYFQYYLARKNAFLQSQEQFDIDCPPDPIASKGWEDWSEYAQKKLKESDHLFLVAAITRSQIRKLNKAGITSVHQLAISSNKSVPGIAPDILLRLKGQADVQIKTREKPVSGW